MRVSVCYAYADQGTCTPLVYTFGVLSQLTYRRSAGKRHLKLLGDSALVTLRRNNLVTVFLNVSVM